MFVRNYKGKIIEFNWRDYSNEKDMYSALWKIMYNVELTSSSSTNQRYNELYPRIILLVLIIF